MSAVVSLVTAEELLRMPSDFRCELIDGVVIEMSPPGELHGEVAGRFTGLLFRAEEAGLGRVRSELGVIVRRHPDTVRAPDVAFIRKDHIPPTGARTGYAQIPPDVVVEVVSPWDTRAEIQAKVREWIEAEVSLVIVAYPEPQTIERIASLQDRLLLSVGDVLDFSPAIPGFSLTVAEIFD